jgi:hypothetical protein
VDIIQPSYHPSQEAKYGGRSWHPLSNTPSYKESEHYSLSVQPFRAGGYEATIRLVDLQEAADRAERPRIYGERVEPSERSEDSLQVARQRAKAMVRKRIKDMGGNRLCTLTVRQNDALGYLSPDEWAKAFAKYVRLLRRAGLMNDYVAIMEPHKKGLERLAARRDASSGAHGVAAAATWDIPLHIHFVTRSNFKMPINLMRKCWLIASGRDGNIDVQWLRSENGSDEAIEKVAAYATKYITKGLAEFERFNKKRYWSAGLPLLKKGITWMRSRGLSDAFNEAREALGLSDSKLGEMVAGRKVFIFPDGCGLWLNVRPGGHAPPPF